MEEQIKEYYAKLQEMFPSAKYVAVYYSASTYAVGWFIRVEFPSSKCECCERNHEVEIYSSVKPSFDEALAEILAKAGV